ncbi:hypothetical protein LJB42_001866 [Komagataella kurtzmanii]|nr:hypothetical protein LJB42_001866 [Komagataella kurtzmanii]
MSSLSKRTKLASLVGYHIRVYTVDSRQLVGELISFDKHMNLVLSETEEFRVTKKSYAQLKKQAQQKAGQPLDESNIEETKRSLGLIILRGEHIVSVSIEGKPNIHQGSRINISNSGGIPEAKGVIRPLKAEPALTKPIKTTHRITKPQGFRKV